MKEEAILFIIKLTSAYMDWCNVCIRGSVGTQWTDGKEMNHIRAKIIQMQAEMQRTGITVPGGCFKDPPPFVEESFMHETEKLCRDAEAALKIYTQDEAYEYLMVNQTFLGKRELNSMQIKPADALKPAVELKKALEKKSYPAMRRYSETEKYLKVMRACRAEMEEVMDDMIPF